MAASDWSVYFWRASDAWGTVGTKRSSFFTSSKGSNTISDVPFLLPSFEAKTTTFLFGYRTKDKPFEFFKALNAEADDENEKLLWLALSAIEEEEEELKIILPSTQRDWEKGRWETMEMVWEKGLRESNSLDSLGDIWPLMMRNVDGWGWREDEERVAGSWSSWILLRLRVKFGKE